MDYQVNVGALPAFYARIEKLNKRAARKGLEPMQVIEKGETFAETGTDAEGNPTVQRVVNIEVVGTTPKIEGFDLLGMVDYRDSFPMVVPFPGATIPSEFYNADVRRCDACGHKRKRKRVFILQNKNAGFHIQTGSECLKDFVGHGSVEGIVAFANFMAELRDLDPTDDDEGGFTSGGTVLYDIRDIIAVSNAAFREYGFVTIRSVMDTKEQSTAFRVSQHLFSTKGERLPVTRADYDMADTIIAWAANVDPNNEYTHNMRAVAEAGTCGYRSFNLTVSIVSAYYREVERIETRKVEQEQAKLSAYVGNIGDRFTKKSPLNVKVVFKRYFDSGLYPKTLYKMRDENGNMFSWWASTNDLEQGEKYSLAATVKDHQTDKYNGDTPTTVLTRCSVV